MFESEYNLAILGQEYKDINNMKIIFQHTFQHPIHGHHFGFNIMRTKLHAGGLLI